MWPPAAWLVKYMFKQSDCDAWRLGRIRRMERWFSAVILNSLRFRPHFHDSLAFPPVSVSVLAFGWWIERLVRLEPKRISVLDWDGLSSGIFYLLGSCQYAKLRNTAFDLLLYSIQPVREEKVTTYVFCPDPSHFFGEILKLLTHWVNNEQLTSSSFKESLSFLRQYGSKRKCKKHNYKTVCRVGILRGQRWDGSQRRTFESRCDSDIDYSRVPFKMEI